MQKLSILVVDDASYIRDLVKRTIRQNLPECQIDEAINGRRANAMLNKKKYDLILCDWEMPEMSGIELLKVIRQQEKQQQLTKTPFVMVTSRGDKKNVIEAVQCGVSDYIGKPFTAEHLIAKVSKALKRKLIKQQSEAQLTYNHGKPLLQAKLNQLQNKAGMTSATTNQQSVYLGQLQVRTAEQQATALIKDINLTHILLEIDSQEMKPRILESVVIDIQPDKHSEKVARINAYVYLLQASGQQEPQKLLVKLQYVDDDEQKLMLLSRYIEQLRRKTN